MPWSDLPANTSGRETLFLAENADGTLREATDRDLWLASIQIEWAAAGHIVPAAIMAQSAADYDAAMMDLAREEAPVN